MLAGTDWAVAVPQSITAVAALIAAFATLNTRRQVNTMAPKVESIDRAVNGQPDDTAPMVDKVTAIGAEQDRVAVELAAKDQPEPP